MSGLTIRFGILAVALVTDRLLGDPPGLWRRLPHPVVLVGRAVEALDRRLNDDDAPYARRRRNGVFALLLLVAGAAIIGWLAGRLLHAMPLQLVIEAVVVAVLLAHESLVDHVAAVERALAKDGLESGRRAVAEIVGRDVSVLDEAGVARAAIESAAENFSDGVIAPAFWFMLLGLPGLFVFKLVNTADSMIGHRTPRHEAFGWAAARLDDVLSFVPARISALLIAVAAFPSRSAVRNAVSAALADAPKHKSPNAGWPEAALAGALGLALGGPRRYGEIAVEGAWLNPGGRRDAGPDDISASVRMINTAWAIAAAIAAFSALTLIAIGR